MRDLTFSDLVLFVFLSLTAARLTRLAFKDTIFDRPRKALVDSLMDDSYVPRGSKVPHKRRRASVWWREKAAELLVCPYCVSAYAAAAVVLAHRIVIEPLAMPVWWWFAIWMAAIVILEYTDGARAQPPKK